MGGDLVLNFPSQRKAMRRFGCKPLDLATTEMSGTLLQFSQQGRIKLGLVFNALQEQRGQTHVFYRRKLERTNSK